MSITAAAAWIAQGWQWVALLSPLFVVLLLTRVSGIPLLEAKADGTWGARATTTPPTRSARPC